MTEEEFNELKLVAKAIGKEISFGSEGILFRNKGEKYWKGWWNPKENNGDALELAAILRLQIDNGKYQGDGCTVSADKVYPGVTGCTAFTENGDPTEQLRFAIWYVALNVAQYLDSIQQ